MLSHMRRILLGLVVLAIILNGIAFARVFGWKTALPALTEEDIAIISKTARVDMNDKPEGSALDWNNPKSGASGTVTLKKRFTFKGHECRELLHSIEVKGQEGWHYLSKICRIDNTWKFLEAPKPVRKPAKKSK